MYLSPLGPLDGQIYTDAEFTAYADQDENNGKYLCGVATFPINVAINPAITRLYLGFAADKAGSLSQNEVNITYKVTMTTAT